MEEKKKKSSSPWKWVEPYEGTLEQAWEYPVPAGQQPGYSKPTTGACRTKAVAAVCLFWALGCILVEGALTMAKHGILY